MHHRSLFGVLWWWEESTLLSNTCACTCSIPYPSIILQTERVPSVSGLGPWGVSFWEMTSHFITWQTATGVLGNTKPFIHSLHLPRQHNQHTCISPEASSRHRFTQASCLSVLKKLKAHGTTQVELRRSIASVLERKHWFILKQYHAWWQHCFVSWWFCFLTRGSVTCLLFCLAA